jgi:hypothetical protein
VTDKEKILKNSREKKQNIELCDNLLASRLLSSNFTGQERVELIH